jgi:hypothetical protein
VKRRASSAPDSRVDDHIDAVITLADLKTGIDET